MGVISDLASPRDPDQISSGMGPEDKVSSVPSVSAVRSPPSSGLVQYVETEGRDITNVYDKSGPVAAAGRATRGGLMLPAVAASDVISSAVGPISQFAGGFTDPGVDKHVLPVATSARPANTSTAPFEDNYYPGNGVISRAAAKAPNAPGFRMGNLRVVDAKNAAGEPTRTITDDQTPDQQSASYEAATQEALRNRYADARSRATNPRYSEDERPDNVRAYLRPPGGDSTLADRALALQNNGTWGGMINARTLLKAAPLETGQYAAETGRITALAGAGRSGAEVAQIGQGLITSRDNLAQPKKLNALGVKLSDPHLSDQERRDLEMQIEIMHGRVEIGRA